MADMGGFFSPKEEYGFFVGEVVNNSILSGLSKYDSFLADEILSEATGEDKESIETDVGFRP